LGKRNCRLEPGKAEKLLKLLFRDFQTGLAAEQSENLVYKKIDANGFNWMGFQNSSAEPILKAFWKKSIPQICILTRNGNPKIVWTDLGIKLSRYIHKS
jgi:hypothetical protein